MPKTLVVTDNAQQLPTLNAKVISFQQYLSEYPKLSEPKTRVINLCDTDKYLSQGYYCSLLAEARQHRVLPSVSTINDLGVYDDNQQSLGIQIPLPETVSKSLAEGKHQCLVFFGHVYQSPMAKVARYVFERFAAPLLAISVEVDNSRAVATIDTLSMHQLDDAQQHAFFEQLQHFTQQVWRSHSRKKTQRWEMAILVNPDEPTPPSDKKALQRFVSAAATNGIHAELVTAAEIGMLSRYDALFIRETTSIKHHTYNLARKAEQEGLVVIDDAASILRCCNKVFLHDAFTYNGIPAPRTHFVSDSTPETLASLVADFGFPMVLKLPESAFSLGVFKVKTEQELTDKLAILLAESALVLVQEYLYTDYDWRIGVLNGRALYACRYHMARGHWQIYNHGAKTKDTSGDFETLPTFEVPSKVLEAALKAAKFIGKGLYGVDLKQLQDQVYVIEVNDNPSIEQGVEDQYLGKELYMQIMQEFANRLEARGR
ncbi:RimK family protein [Aestuariibacter sp. AA17]|uniref:RimK family protein n=1 Tax=Fluctibacter corallii TaxID=2984329 RepID=A0ABT3AA15_9ALTE|nr:RimK family protein [Aestuariibacter sp. AA17]MCV2885522.1 RimK family protein [Aestuariibacter sp. AA17]